MLFFVANVSLAQQNKEEIEYKNSIGFVPHYLIMNGLGLNYERKIGDKQWLALAPQLYANEQSESNSYDLGSDGFYTSLLGVGLTVMHKYDFIHDLERSIYIAYGMEFNYFELKYPYEAWYTYEENGLEYYTYGIAEYKETIQRAGVDILIGYRWHPLSNFYTEIYTGGGIRKSFSETNQTTNPQKFDEYMNGYGYTGTVFLIGLKIGFLY